MPTQDGIKTHANRDRDKRRKARGGGERETVGVNSLPPAAAVAVGQSTRSFPARGAVAASEVREPNGNTQHTFQARENTDLFVLCREAINFRAELRDLVNKQLPILL